MPPGDVPALLTMVAGPRPDYALLDSGGGRKLERYGARALIRPDAQAMWAPAAPNWRADGEFLPGSDDDGGGRWDLSPVVPRDGWPLELGRVRIMARCTPFRHLGYFPDMAPVWDWTTAHLAGVDRPQCLNLFGYTGVGSLALAAAGAEVVHVDASRKSVGQARDNAALSDLADAPIRWLVDDARKFVAREVRRGRRYDGIILDPPKYGRGPEGEAWHLADDLAPLLIDCRRLVDGRSRFCFLTVYAVRLSALALGTLIAQVFGDLPGHVAMGELSVREEARGILLPTAIWARWSNEVA